MKHEEKLELLLALVANMRLYQKDGRLDKAEFYERQVDELVEELRLLMWEEEI